jgi:hypothetical protein
MFDPKIKHTRVPCLEEFALLELGCGTISGWPDIPPFSGKTSERYARVRNLQDRVDEN